MSIDLTKMPPPLMSVCMKLDRQITMGFISNFEQSLNLGECSARPGLLELYYIQHIVAVHPCGDLESIYPQGLVTAGKSEY